MPSIRTLGNLFSFCEMRHTSPNFISKLKFEPGITSSPSLTMLCICWKQIQKQILYCRTKISSSSPRWFSSSHHSLFSVPITYNYLRNCLSEPRFLPLSVSFRLTIRRCGGHLRLGTTDRWPAFPWVLDSLDLQPKVAASWTPTTNINCFFFKKNAKFLIGE